VVIKMESKQCGRKPKTRPGGSDGGGTQKKKKEVHGVQQAGGTPHPVVQLTKVGVCECPRGSWRRRGP